MCLLCAVEGQAAPVEFLQEGRRKAALSLGPFLSPICAHVGACLPPFCVWATMWLCKCGCAQAASAVSNCTHRRHWAVKRGFFHCSHPPQSAFDYDDALGEYTFPNMGYEGVPASASGSSASKPRIILMGLRRSGKSSIQKVVFSKMSPNETLFLESTTRVHKTDVRFAPSALCFDWPSH